MIMRRERCFIHDYHPKAWAKYKCGEIIANLHGEELLKITYNNFIALYESGIMLAELDSKREHMLFQAVDEIRIGERLGPGGLRGLQIRREASKMSLVGSTPIRSRHL